MPIGNGRFVYTLRIDLAGVKPPIWRRIGVDSEMPLAMLHEVIQLAFGWHDVHLHVFEIGPSRYATPDALPMGGVWDEMEYLDARQVRLGELVGNGDTFIYRYDFGDDWEHRIKVENIEPLTTPHLSYAWLMTGQRAGPPEDVGGVWGYEELLEGPANPDSPAAQERLAWLGKEFDPEFFDFEETRVVILNATRRTPKNRV